MAAVNRGLSRLSFAQDEIRQKSEFTARMLTVPPTGSRWPLAEYDSERVTDLWVGEWVEGWGVGVGSGGGQVEADLSSPQHITACFGLEVRGADVPAQAQHPQAGAGEGGGGGVGE